MLNGMMDSVKGCLKEETRMDVISNNLANVNVIGFKKDKLAFRDVLAQVGNGGKKVNTDESGRISENISLKTDHSPGDLKATGNSLDLAISGSGFFKVNTPEGIRYTRKGNFILDPQGYLMTQRGFMVIGKEGIINLSNEGFLIDERGAISVNGQIVGQIDIVDFEDLKTLQKDGSNLYRNALDHPEEILPPETKIMQGYVELSNVNVSEEMVQMIHSLRAFESYQKIIQVLDGINNKAINQVGRLR